MRIDVNEQGGIELREVFAGLSFVSPDGARLVVCMRDGTFEINFMPEDESPQNWWRCHLATGRIYQLGEGEAALESRADARGAQATGDSDLDADMV